MAANVEEGAGTVRDLEIKIQSRAVGEALRWTFNPTVARYKEATGQSNGHKVQKWSLRDTKSTQSRNSAAQSQLRESSRSCGVLKSVWGGERIVGGGFWWWPGCGRGLSGDCGGKLERKSREEGERITVGVEKAGSTDRSTDWV